MSIRAFDGEGRECFEYVGNTETRKNDFITDLNGNQWWVVGRSLSIEPGPVLVLQSIQVMFLEGKGLHYCKSRICDREVPFAAWYCSKCFGGKEE